MQGFEFQTAKLIVNEFGGAANIAEYCRRLHIKHLFVVTDKGIIEHGLLDDIQSSLNLAQIKFTIFDAILPDPSQEIIEDASLLASQEKVDGVLGIGGGSSLDSAKLAAILASKQQSLNDILGIDQVKSTRLPLILIPTTAGTGSEVTPIAIVTTGDTTKSAVVSSKLLPDIALLDANLSLDLPPHITAATGIDAMVHALEAYTSKIKKNSFSDLLAKEALVLLASNIEACVADGKNKKARQDMLLGACFAGQAFANAPVAAVHALAYPLGGHFKISHGLSNSLVLPHVIRFNMTHAENLYRELLPILLPNASLVREGTNASELLADYFYQLAGELGLPQRLSQLDINASHLSMLAKDAMLQTRLLMNNPKEVNYDNALNIYQDAL